jgi:hypothetical protein
MANKIFQKLAPLFISAGILALATYFTYDGYTKSTTPSAFELAANRLGFNGYKKADKIVSAAHHQEALLKQLQWLAIFNQQHYGKLSII